MRKVSSNQKDVPFAWCPSPVTIDKRGEWGASAENLQHGPGGAFLKFASPTSISHLVQPNADKTAPVGWIVGSGPGLFSKSDIWITCDELQPGARVGMQTADGPISYDVKVPSMVCYNDKDGAPNLDDGWVQTMKDLKKNYVL